MLISAGIEQQSRKGADTDLLSGRRLAEEDFFFFSFAVCYFTVGGKLMAKVMMTADLKQLQRTRGQKCPSLKYLSK